MTSDQSVHCVPGNSTHQEASDQSDQGFLLYAPDGLDQSVPCAPKWREY